MDINEIIIIALLALNSVIGIAVLIYFRSHSRQNQEEQQEDSKELFRLEYSLKDEFAKSREELAINLKTTREELMNSQSNFQDSMLKRITEIAQLEKGYRDSMITQLEQLTKSNEEKLDKVKEAVESKLKYIQEDNNRQLEKMRETVDEKLQKTLETRLGESFKIVSDRLEQVHKGLGEMHTLAVGVGDLKKVLTNVKTRGVLGEYQLENILEEILTREQYEKNVKTKDNSNAFVEFAIKLPGRENDDKSVWLPMDSKFPTEDYQLLLEAYENGNIALIEEAKKQLSNRIKASAKEIKDKYIDPPNTTDFAIMFLPFEGLYAEVLRIGLFEMLQRDYKIIITGPTTVAALLNSLQMGFRTLAIEKRSSEVWEVLGAVKAEFNKFGDVLEKTQKKLNEASNVIKQAGVRSRAIQKKLKNVELLPKDEGSQYFLEEDFSEEELDEIDE